MGDTPEQLPGLKRFITGHDEKGLAVFDTSLSEDASFTTVGVGDKFWLGYATKGQPTDLTKDLDVYKGYLDKPPGIVVPGGSVLRVVDIRPGGSSPMHRTVSLDYGVVLEGEIELELDSGETRTLHRGDHAVQRGTMHLWRNRTDKWARMLFVLQECKPITVAGKQLGEDYGLGMNDVRPSAD